jgi:hypothetical protein
MRRSNFIETPLPILYLKGISTGDFSEALAAWSARLRPTRHTVFARALPTPGLCHDNVLTVEI